MNFGLVLCVTFLAIASIAAQTGRETLASMLLYNAVFQISLFIIVACIPFLKTGRMSYVDIAWPFGVALIGVQILVMGDGDVVRTCTVGGVYLLIGLRMGIGAVSMAKATGVIFKTEFPRYSYRRMTLEESGGHWMRFHMLSEILAQGFANMSVLALPGFLIAINSELSLSPWEVVGICIWITAYLLESTADVQKLRYMSNNKGSVCNVGLWRFSRHPNYFAEWMVWTGLVLAAVPSWFALKSEEALHVWITLGLGAAGASVMMYITLIYLTGAIPAEYFSAKKRPEYKQYQQTTNMFFPWFPKDP